MQVEAFFPEGSCFTATLVTCVAWCACFEVHLCELLLPVSLAEGQNTSGEFRDSTTYLCSAGTNVWHALLRRIP